MKTKITKITSEFNNVYRIEGNNFMLDIFSFEDNDIPVVGKTLEYRFLESHNDIPKTGIFMNGKAIKLTKDGQTHVSFGGLMGSFSGYKVEKIGDPVSIWINILTTENLI